MESSNGKNYQLAGTSKATTSCAICCQEKPNLAFIVLSQCRHESCGDCLTQWIEKVESTGQRNMPGCPFCRVEMTKEETTSILGRPYRHKTASGAASLEDVDELTRQWIESQTVPCVHCGARIEKIDGCDLMECLCSYRFCYSCGTQGADCFCTPPNHYFWDNIHDCSADRRAPTRAPTSGVTGEVNLREHIERRRQEGNSLPNDPMQGFDGSESSPLLPNWDSPSTSPCYSPTYSPMSQSGRALALQSADYPNARQFGQPEAPPPPPPLPVLHPSSSSSLHRLMPLSTTRGSASPEYSVTSATFSPLHEDESLLLESCCLLACELPTQRAITPSTNAENRHKQSDAGREPMNGGWDEWC